MKTRYYKEMLTILLISILLLVQCSRDDSETNSYVYDLTSTINPFGIDDFKPYFSWKTKTDQHHWMQGGWRIIVADNDETIKFNEGNIWDSKKVLSDQQLFVAYQGKPLITGKKYFWRLEVWDTKGRVSFWSDIQSFRVPLDYEKDWKADWITYDYSPSTAAPLLRKSFNLKGVDQVVSAILYIYADWDIMRHISMVKKMTTGFWNQLRPIMMIMHSIRHMTLILITWEKRTCWALCWATAGLINIWYGLIINHMDNLFCRAC